MKAIHLFFITFLLGAGMLYSQGSLHYKVKQESGMISPKFEYFFQNGVLKYKNMTRMQKEYYIVTKDSIWFELDQGMNHFCSKGTHEEFARDWKEKRGKKYPFWYFDSVKIEKVNEIAVVLDSTCKKLLISCKLVAGGRTTPQVHEAWYVESIKTDSINMFMKYIYPENKVYYDLLSKLGVLVIKTDVLQKGKVVSGAYMTEIDKKKMNASDLGYEQKCGSVSSFEEFRKKMEALEARVNMFGR